MPSYPQGHSINLLLNQKEASTNKAYVKTENKHANVLLDIVGHSFLPISPGSSCTHSFLNPSPHNYQQLWDQIYTTSNSKEEGRLFLLPSAYTMLVRFLIGSTRDPITVTRKNEILTVQS